MIEWNGEVLESFMGIWSSSKKLPRVSDGFGMLMWRVISSAHNLAVVQTVRRKLHTTLNNICTVLTLTGIELRTSKNPYIQSVMLTFPLHHRGQPKETKIFTKVYTWEPNFIEKKKLKLICEISYVIEIWSSDLDSSLIFAYYSWLCYGGFSGWAVKMKNSYIHETLVMILNDFKMFYGLFTEYGWYFNKGLKRPFLPWWPLRNDFYKLLCETFLRQQFLVSSIFFL
jgi:hypothetical protein